MGSRSRKGKRRQQPISGRTTREPYRKKFLTLSEQVEHLRDRGMEIDNCDHARELLRRVGYYRLSGYWYIYKDNASHQKGTFVEGVSLRDIEKLYNFDRDLRMLVFSAIERIEVALRAAIGHTLGAHGSMSHTNPSLFRDSFTNAHLYGEDSTTLKAAERYYWMRSDHYEWLKTASRKTERSKADFVKHFKRKYGMPLPIWVVTEVIDFSDLSRIYEGMNHDDRSAVARSLGVTGEDGKPLAESLRSWLRALTFVRNTCAHHSRLWNINMVEQIAPSEPFPTDLKVLAELSPRQHARIYPTLAIISYLITQIHPQMDWSKSLKKLLDVGLPQSDCVNYLKRMGFPQNWEQFPVWSIPPTRRAAHVDLVRQPVDRGRGEVEGK